MTTVPQASTPIDSVPLSDVERAHSARVVAEIRRQIYDNGGWLAFDRFMDAALYAPGLGYYSAGSRKFGPGGDFTTAPEISSLFSGCVAEQCAQILRALAREYAAPEILEIGAGTGRMAVDLLLELARLEILPSRYRILEVSAELRSRQQAAVAALPPGLRERVVWLDALPAEAMTGIILANEVLDALACRRFVAGSALSEVGVEAHGDDALRTALRPASDSLAAECATIMAALPEILPAGYLSEVCPRVDAWVGTFGAALNRGAMLVFDYGLPRAQYYHPQRSAGTLRCHFRQRVHDDPLINIGMQDITAWVDFTRVAEAAVAAGLQVSGFATQAAFLLGTGIGARLARQATGIAQIKSSAEAQRLLLPGEMGEAFKAMALTRDLDLPLVGFQLQDLRRSL